ncbi:MAG: thiamine phosphate synthase [Pseudomonadota bacterium]
MDETDQVRARVYLISPPTLPDITVFADAFRAALSGGDVACFQLRLKSPAGEPAPDDDVLRATEALLPIAKAADVAFLMNDRPDLAQASGADGVHVGQSDASCREARALLGPDASIGVTCHASIDLGFKAGEDGADYAAFGAFFPTETKSAPTQAPISVLEQWREATVLPCVAIGGVTAQNCGPLVRAGADFLAVSAGVWRAPEGPEAAVAALNSAIDRANDSE